MKSDIRDNVSYDNARHDNVSYDNDEYDRRDNDRHNTVNAVRLYQKGYADGYRRQRERTTLQRENEYRYIVNVLVIVLVFTLFMLLSMFVFGRTGENANYKGDCLVDLATTYKTDGCLDN
ncbi:hypothetical protein YASMINEVIRUS_1067 [Yasminevirus sp. GU-2018]|uniref:Uncharacterized protein n=1 Tax=Yasminevirus sp. GU-2018 TaxID=2420051 RepID=A0A5K0UAU1_9VIRU|nr:hypothetical protein YASMINEVIRUS_1067 [Yasminevirus sp. GU-2018]